MIKQSFLRNYNLGKIYSQAEDQKKKLQVLYIRQVNKILKHKHDVDRQLEKQTTSKQNKEQFQKMKQQIKEIRQSMPNQKREMQLRRKNKKTKSTELGEQSLDERKVDLFISTIELQTNKIKKKTERKQFWKIKTILNRSFHKKVLNSFINIGRQDHQNSSKTKIRNSFLHELTLRNKNNTVPSFHESLDKANTYSIKKHIKKMSNLQLEHRHQVNDKEIKLIKQKSNCHVGKNIKLLKNSRFNEEFVTQLTSKGILQKLNPLKSTSDNNKMKGCILSDKLKGCVQEKMIGCITKADDKLYNEGK